MTYEEEKTKALNNYLDKKCGNRDSSPSMRLYNRTVVYEKDLTEDQRIRLAELETNGTIKVNAPMGHEFWIDRWGWNRARGFTALDEWDVVEVRS